METGEQGEAARLEDARGQGEAAWVEVDKKSHPGPSRGQDEDYKSKYW